MCLAIPMKIIEIHGDTAVVAIGKLRQRINIAMVSAVKVGDYVLAHAGFAIEKIDEQSARETLTILHEIC